MNNSWDIFTEIHGGSFLARDSFEDFCLELLDMHYPGKDVVSNSKFENYSSKKISVVFLSKFFTDELNNSRKGQIRNAFNSFIKDKKRSNQKVYAWIICVPYILNEEEMKWWLSWKSKATLKYSVNIQIFDGNYCLEIAKKYDLYNKWFTKSTTEAVKAEPEKIEEEIITLERSTDQVFELIDESTKTEESEKTVKEEKTTEKVPVEKTEVQEESTFKYAEKLQENYKYETFLSEFTRIKEVAETLTEEEEKQLKEINFTKNWKKTFDKIEIEDLDTLKIFYKAKSNEVHKNYAPAVYLYEEILKRDDYKSLLKFKIKEIGNSLKQCQNKTEAFLYELEGDVHFVRKSLANATIAYEKAYKTDANNKVIAKKYFETLADNQLESDIPEQAVKNYQKASEIDSKDTKLQEKLKNAKWLDKGNNFFKSSVLKPVNSFLAPLAFFKAYSVDKDKKTKEKLDKSVKKFYFSFSVLAIIIIVAVFAIKKANLKTPVYEHKTPIVSVVDSTGFLKAISPSDAAVMEGDQIMNSITFDKIHLIDTAIAAYNRALSYNGKVASKNKKVYTYKSQNKYTIDSIADIRLNEAKKYKNNYVNNAQANILRDSASYFVSMRRNADGLKLFKYLFEPNNRVNGKYGYVDSMMNIVVPPVYDFDYKKMYKGNENFIDGKAFVCLVNSAGDTTYFYINKANRRVSR